MNWKPYPSDRVSKVTSTGVVVIKPSIDTVSIPLACPTCNELMRDSDDEREYQQFGCCRLCADAWAYPYRDKWLQGWRPDASEVAPRVALRPKLILKLS